MDTNTIPDLNDARKGGLALLRKEFPPHQISKLPKPLKKREEMDRIQKGKCSECGGYHAVSSVMHLDYVGHAALTDRLLDADPTWSWEPVAIGGDGLPLFDKHGGLWIRLTVCGVTRLGYGHADKSGGDAVKEIIGDALRNAAMRFGAALDLWHKGQLHVDEAPDDGDAESADDGYIDFVSSLEEIASNGSEALLAAIKADTTPDEWRARLRKDGRTWANLKARADKAGKAVPA